MAGRVVPPLPVLMVLGDQLRRARERAEIARDKPREPRHAEADTQHGPRRAA